MEASHPAQDAAAAIQGVVPPQAEADKASQQKAVEGIVSLAKAQRSSLEDLATELSAAFNGAPGMAQVLSTVALAPETRPATRVKIMQTVTSVIERASRQYGDNRNVESMSTRQIKARLKELLAEHDNLDPVTGEPIT